MTKDEALNMALDYLRNLDKAEWSNSERFDVIASILKALAEPKPVGWGITESGRLTGSFHQDLEYAEYLKRDSDERWGQRDQRKVVPVFLQPPKREWFGLQDMHLKDMRVDGPLMHKWVRRAEQKLKTLNT